MRKRFKKLVLITLAIIVTVHTFSFTLLLEASQTYDGVFEGNQSEPILLQSGKYLFKNVTVRGNASQPSAVRIYGHATIVLEGKNYVYGKDASGHGPGEAKSGAGFEVLENTNISLTLQGDEQASLEVKGGNASRGQDGVSGTDGDGIHGGTGGAGGAGGNGASAAIGGTGGYYDGSNKFAAGNNSGEIILSGNFSLKTVGGSGAEGGTGGSGGHSDASYKFLWCDISSGGGGGGGGGGGWPAASIGGGGAAGSKGGDATDGRGRNPSTAAVNISVEAGGGGGGGRGWGAGGGGGSGFFAFYQGRDKYSNIRPSGGRGGKSPTEPGEGGCVGIMEATLAGGGNSAGAYRLVVSSYSGDYPSYDVDGTRVDRDAQGYNEGRRYGQFACQGTMEYKHIDAAWAFYIQNTNMKQETPEASGKSGDGIGRRYELYVSAGGAGGLGEESKRGKAQYNLQKADGVKLDATGLVPYGDGGGTDGYGVPKPITQVIDLADPETKITFSPARSNYTGNDFTPEVTIVSKNGTRVDAGAFSMTLKEGAANSIGKRVYSFSGKGNDYPTQKVINYTERDYYVDKGYRKDVLRADKYMINQGASVTLYLENHVFDNCEVTWDITASNGIKIENAPNGTTNIIKTLEGTGQIKAKAHISEGDFYYEYTTEEITITVAPPGADLFTIQNLSNQIYNGTAHEPSFDVYYGGKLLEKGKDYKVQYLNNVNVGEAKVVIEGINNFTGSIESWFSISPADIKPVRFGNADNSKVPPKLPDLYYTASSQVSVPKDGKWNGINVQEGVDYLLSYSETINVGEVTVTVIGINNFTGTTTLTYNILPSDISKISNILVVPPEDLIYDGTSKQPKVQVTLQGLELTEGKDYTLRYENNIKAGTATVYIYGKGNFRGDSFLTETFTIKRKPLYINPKEGQNKYSGEYDPEHFEYTLDGVVDGDEVHVQDNTNLSRIVGEDTGRYRFLKGNLSLDPAEKDNANYELQMKSEAVNFEIKRFDIAEEATLVGTYNEDTGWYTSITKLVAPEGYLISRSNDVVSTDTPEENSPWKPYIEADDGDYSTGYTYYLKQIPKEEGKVGFISQAKTVIFKQDSTLSTIEINMNDKRIYTTHTDTVTKTSYFNSDVSIEVTTKDATSGLEKVDYYFADEEMSKENLNSLSENKWKHAKVDKHNMILNQEMKKILYVRAVDVAGNVKYVNTDIFVIDKTNPTIEIQYDDVGRWVAENADVIITAKDILAGIKDRNLDYHFEFIKDGKETDINLLKLNKDDQTSVSNLPDGEYNLIVSAKDNANNYYENSVLIRKDSIAPILELDGNIKDYALYKDIEIKASVGASGVDKVYIQYQNYGDECDPTGTWTEITADYNNDKKYIVDNNGTYYVKYTNGTGATSNIASISFDTIDKLTPVVNVSGISNELPIQSDTWSYHNVDVLFSNSEVNNLGRTKFSYRSKDKNDPLSVWSEWNTVEKGNDYQASVLVGQSGVTLVEVKITSAAGLSNTGSFIVKIDKQKPNIAITLDDVFWSKIQNNTKFDSYYKDTKIFKISGKDTLSGVNKIEYFLAEENFTEDAITESDLEAYVTSHGGWLNKPLHLNSIEIEVTPNRKYIVYGKVSDAMGNFTYASSDGVILDNEAPTLNLSSDSFVDIENKGKWLLNNNDFVIADVVDSLSGPSTIQYYEGDVSLSKVLDASLGSANIAPLKDGLYTLNVTAFDKAGNATTKAIDIQKDVVSPEVELDGDNYNFSEEVHTKINPIVGISGINKLEMKFVGTGENEEDIAFEDIKNKYADGFDVIKNGTLIVTIEDNLGRTSETRLEFNNIRYIDPKIMVDCINEDQEVVVSENWYSAINIRFYNDPRNVVGLTYEYSVDNDTNWVQTTAHDGYALIPALEGEHIYYLRLTNNKTMDTSEANITVKVDNTKPTGVIQLEADNTEYVSIESSNGFVKGLKEATSVTLKNVTDANLSSGIHTVEYYVLTAGENQRVKKYPIDEKTIKEQITNKWIPLNKTEIESLLAGGTFKIQDLKVNQEYMIFIKIKDRSGNVTFLSTDGISIDATKPTIETDYKKGTWITNDTEIIRVTVKDNLSGVKTGEYTIATGAPSRDDYAYTIEDRKDSFEIESSRLLEGVSILGIDATDICGNEADYYQIEILKDTKKPVIKVKENEQLASRDIPYIDIETIVGDSDVKSVSVQRDDQLVATDITKTYAGGYQPTRNGTYTFIVTNNAGILSEPAQISFNNLGVPPELILNATNSLGEHYIEGTWSNSNVNIALSTKDFVVGESKYEYSLDKGATWQVVSRDEQGYHIEVSKSGTFNYLFKVTTAKGAESDIVKFTVNTDFEKPEFDYELSPKEKTSLWTDMTILPNDKNKKYTYSFDGGVTYQEEPVKRFTSNGNIEVVVRNMAGAIAKKVIKIDNIDRLSPYMTIYKNSVLDNNMYAISLEAEDATANLDFAETGVEKVFITNDNPFSEQNVRTEPLQSDYLLTKQDDGLYGTTNVFKAEKDGNLADNYWIIVTDNVGNYNIRSFRVMPGGESIEDPGIKPIEPTPDNPQKPNDKIDDTLNELEKSEKELGMDVAKDKETLRNNQEVVSNLISTVTNNKDISLDDEVNYLEKIKDLDITNEQKSKINARLENIQSEQVRKIVLWIIALILFIIGLICLWKQKKMEKQLEECEETVEI